MNHERPSEPDRPRVVPNLYGIAFGLIGLSGCWRVASSAIGAPSGVADGIAILAALVWVAVGVGRLAERRVTGRSSFSTDLKDPVLGPFVSLGPIVGMLLALALYPHSATAAHWAFGAFLVLAALNGAWLTGDWLVASVRPESVHPGYFLPTVTGGLVAAEVAAAMGWTQIAEASFGVGVICWLVFGSIILNRLIVGPKLPAPLLPSLALEVGPPAVAADAWLSMNGGSFDAVVVLLTGYTVLIVLMQVRLLELYRQAPFGPGFWSFAFSFASVATLAINWLAHARPAGADAWSWIVLGVISLGIATLAIRTADALRRRRFIPRIAVT